MNSSRLLVVLGVLVLGGLAACRPQTDSPEALPRPRRIILVSMDTVRADHVSGYADVDTAPTLREIASQGALFRNFYAAASYTLPSHASIFTGLHPSEHAVLRPTQAVPDSIPLLAERLRRAGYRTRSDNEAGYVAARFGFDRGFEIFRERGRLGMLRGGLSELRRWMAARGGEPYFVFVHTYAAHFPYGGFKRYREAHPERGLPSDEELAALRAKYKGYGWKNKRASESIPVETRRTCTLFNYLVDKHHDVLRCGDRQRSEILQTGPHAAPDLAAIVDGYDERIRAIDAAIAKLRSDLVARGQWEDTLFIVTSDHGEAFYEHGLQAHGFVPFDEVLRIPLIISFPRFLRSARVVDGLTWHLDLLPTILRFAGATPPPGLQGIDLTPMLRGKASVPADRAVHPLVLSPDDEFGPPRSVRIERMLKFIEGHPLFGDEGGLLFDLAADPTERHNLRSLRAADAERMAAAIAKSGAGMERAVAGATVEKAAAAPDEAELERLRGLGYVD